MVGIVGPLFNVTVNLPVLQTRIPNVKMDPNREFLGAMCLGPQPGILPPLWRPQSSLDSFSLRMGMYKEQRDTCVRPHAGASACVSTQSQTCAGMRT